MPRFENYPALSLVPRLAHAFTLRQPGIDVSMPREAAVERLQPSFTSTAAMIGFTPPQIATAEQVHGAHITPVIHVGQHCPGADGLITNQINLALGILVADCCAIFAVDPVHRALGLFHSGKKGSELGITGKGIRLMSQHYGTNPADLTIVLSPCIRPPDYEVDFAALIHVDCARAGVPSAQIHDTVVSTASDLSRYYSYRLEKGKTGRMMALIGFLSP